MLSFIEDASVMVSVHSSKTQTKIEVGTPSTVAVIDLTIFCLECGFGDFGFGQPWNALSGT